jgi:hypothetical protein
LITALVEPWEYCHDLPPSILLPLLADQRNFVPIADVQLLMKVEKRWHGHRCWLQSPFDVSCNGFGSIPGWYAGGLEPRSIFVTFWELVNLSPRETIGAEVLQFQFYICPFVSYPKDALPDLLLAAKE